MVRAPRDLRGLLARLPDDGGAMAWTDGRRRGRDNCAAMQIAPWRSAPCNEEEEQEEGHTCWSVPRGRSTVRRYRHGGPVRG